MYGCAIFENIAVLLSNDVNTGRRALWGTASRGCEALLPLQTDHERPYTFLSLDQQSHVRRLD